MVMGTVALITGGGRGIGAATSVRLAEAGWTVCVGYQRDSAAAEAVVERCVSSGVRASAVQADVGTDEGVAALFAAADSFGRLGALINNAGVVDVMTRVEDMSSERLTRIMSVNVLGPFLCSAAAIKRMARRHGGDGGAIVNVGSISARMPTAGRYIDYSASKAAVDVLTIGLAKEVAGDGIRVNCVRPGIIDTEINAMSGQPDRAREMAGEIPLGRAGSPEEIAAAIAWLCSDEASYVSGAVLDVGGAI
jgi:NAD(P)-dependent dehydrogenase (short-subunit alcohol dehydrogenase family)